MALRGPRAYDELDPALPLALLPVRLETRYFRHRGEDVLGIRVFPDTIHADDHRDALTERELNAGRRYWLTVWTATDDVAVAESQRWLASNVGAHRAVYVAQALTPRNLADRPDGEPTWPEVTPSEEIEPVTARLLPDEWLLRIYAPNETVVHQEYRELRVPDLVMAPSLAPGHDTRLGDDPRGVVRGFLADQNLGWTLDFDAALDIGMAFRVPRQKLPNRIRTLLVTGVRAQRDAKAESDAFFSLCTAHRYSRGLDIVPQGTATNNSDAGRSGVAIHDPDIPTLFDVAARPGPGDRRALIDAMVNEPSAIYLAQAADAVSLAFGRVDPNAFDWTEHAAFADGTAAWAMNVGIGYATFGGFLDGPMLTTAGAPTVPPQRSAELRDWYCKWVRGGAALPTIRCGEQPYGLLPITSRLQETDDLSEFRGILTAALLELLELWRAALPVPTLDPDATDGRPAADPATSAATIASVLGAVPHPTALQLRDAEDIDWFDRFGLYQILDSITDQISINAIEEWAQLLASNDCIATWTPRRDAIDSRIAGNNPTIDRQHAEATAFLQELHDLEQSWQEFVDQIRSAQASVEQHLLPVLAERLAAMNEMPSVLDHFHDRGGVGSADALSLTATVFDADALGLDALVVEVDPADLRTGSTSSIQAGGPLYSLWRWGIDVRSELRQLIADDALDERTSQATGSSLLVQLLDTTYQVAPTDDLPRVSLAFWIIDRIRMLSESISSGEPTPDMGLPEDAPTPVVTNPFGGAVVPVGEVVDHLERLMRETLGLAMHRLDAWVLSLANERFAAVRTVTPVGIQLGAYGWLVDLEPSDEGVSQGFIHAPSLSHATTAAVLRAGWSGYGTSAGDAPLSVDLSSARVRRAQWILDGLRNGQDLAGLLGARLERILHDRRLDRLIEPVRLTVLDALGEPGPANAVVDGLVVARAMGGPASDRTDREAAVAEALRAAGLAAPPADRPAWDGVRSAAREVNADLDSVADVVMFQSVHSLLQGDTPAAQAAIAISSGTDAPIPPVRATASQRDAQLIAHRVVAVLGEVDPVPVALARPLRAANNAVAAFVESVVPSAGDVVVGWIAEATREVVRFDLADLRIDVVDAVLLAGDGATQDGSDLGRAVSALVEGRRGEPGRVVFDRLTVRPREVSLDEFGLIASRLADALGRSRPLHAGDLVLPDVDVDGARYDLTDLYTRVDATRAALAALVVEIRSADRATRAAALVRTAAMGVPGGLVALEAELDTDPTGGPSDLEALVERIETRLGDSSPVPTEPDLTGTVDDAAVVTGQIEALVGRRLPVVARFVPVVPVKAAPAGSAPATQVATGGSTWLRQVGRVRPSVGALAETLLLTTAVGVSPVPVLAFQQPDADGPWVATNAPQSSGDQLHVLSVSGAVPVAGDAALGGLLIDSWTESIPRADQATGVAVHFDAPSARPPQTILLSTVERRPGFSVDELSDQLLVTLELAKLRAVGPIDLGLGQLFPAVYLPSRLVTADDRQAREASS